MHKIRKKCKKYFIASEFLLGSPLGCSIFCWAQYFPPTKKHRSTSKSKFAHYFFEIMTTQKKNRKNACQKQKLHKITQIHGQLPSCMCLYFMCGVCAHARVCVCVCACVVCVRACVYLVEASVPSAETPGTQQSAEADDSGEQECPAEAEGQRPGGVSQPGRVADRSS